MINCHCQWHCFQYLVRCIAAFFFLLSKGLCTSMFLKLCPIFVPHFVWGFLGFWTFVLLSDFQLLITALTILPFSNACSFTPFMIFYVRNKCNWSIILTFSVLLCEKRDNQAILSIIKTPHYVRAIVSCPKVWLRYVWHLFWVLSLFDVLSNCQLITSRWEECFCMIYYIPVAT